jgi:hypothetical protein
LFGVALFALVGMEALGQGPVAVLDFPQGGPFMQTEKPPGLIQFFESHKVRSSCRHHGIEKKGTPFLSCPGEYGN